MAVVTIVQAVLGLVAISGIVHVIKVERAGDGILADRRKSTRGGF